MPQGVAIENINKNQFNHYEKKFSFLPYGTCLDSYRL